MPDTLPFIKRVNSGRTFSIPSDVMEAAGIQEGDIVEFHIAGILQRADRTTSPAHAR